MAECSNQGSGSGNFSGENSDVVELKIKTLDSQIFSFEVNKNMLVSLFKEKIANQIGVPVGQQRLIYRGKVLKDDHILSEYHVENGCTLHLVQRQPSQSQSSADASAGATNQSYSTGGSDGNAGIMRNRVGQISHSVVLGTFNVGDQGESVVPDLGRVIGAVLNSFGVGGQPLSNGSNAIQSSTLAPQGNEANGMHGTVTSQSQGGNQTQSAQHTSGQSFQFSPQAASAVPIPSLASPIPDSLNTLCEFMNRMELALSQNGYQQNVSTTNAGDLPRVALPSDSRGLPTPEALSIVLRNVERLLSNYAIAALSHIAGRLEQERDSSDSSVRGQIQTESIQIGRAMQHFGALLLELGRSMLTLRMGQSPLESAVHPGPAVYISPLGPNPIMVQPFPVQATSLFSGSSGLQNPMTSGPVGTGGAPRHINIHIHAGTSLAPVVSAVGNRTNNVEGMQGERSSNAGSGGSGSVRVLPMRTVAVTAVPARPFSAQSSGQPSTSVSVSQPPTDSLLSSTIAEYSSQLRNLVGNTEGESHPVSGNDPGNVHPNSTAVVGAEGPTVALSGVTPETEVHEHSEASHNRMAETVLSLTGASTCTAGETLGSSGETALKSQDPSGGSVRSSEDGAQSVPLGLGLGGLELKRRVKTKPSGKYDGSGAGAFNRNLNGRTSGQQLLQAVGSRSSAVPRMEANDITSSGSVVGSSRTSVGPVSVDQFDTSTAVSQVLQSRALDGLLTGVSQQTGVGSPDLLRNMLQQLTQSPQIMNTVSQIAHQVDSQGLGNMFSELGGGQDGGINLAQMVQQMMPVVSQALGRGLNTSEPELLIPSDERGPSRTDGLNNENFQIDIREVAQDVEHFNSPEEVFHVVFENAVRLLGNERNAEDLWELICSESLANEYTRILHHDIQKRIQDSS